MPTPLKKETLIDLYWILDAVQKGTGPDLSIVAACFVEVRDSLLRPDTEEIVDHIRGALVRQQAAADTLARQATARAMTTVGRPLPDERLVELIAAPAARHGVAEAAAAALAVDYGRLVEAAHGIGEPQ